MKASVNGASAAGRRVGRVPAGFTLVEVLVVMGFIAAVAGVLGLALFAPAGGVALQAGQRTLATLCSAARARAVVTGGDARLLVAAGVAGSADRLRYLEIVHADPAGPDRWLTEGAGFLLPSGIYVVPPTAGAVPGGAAWPEGRCSTALSPSAEMLTINGAEAGPFYSVSFTARGTTRGGSVVLTAGRESEGGAGPQLEFAHPDRVRGVRLRTSGALTLLDEPGALDP